VSAAYAQFVVAPPASVTVSPSPANGIVCNGDSYGILVTNYGVGPFTNIWNDGAVSNSVNSGVYTRTFTAPNNTNINTAIYVTNYIETATAYNGFPATNTGSHLVFTIEPTIKATVSILNAIGNVTNIYSGQTITNQVVLTGYGPLNVQWSGQSNSVPTASGDGPFTNYYAVTLTNSSLSLPATNYIALVGLSSAGDCPVPSNGVTNSVVVWPAPVLQIAPVYYTNIFTNKKSQTITNLAFTNLVLTWFAPAPINLQSATNLVTPGGANSWVYVTNSTLAVTNTAKIGATNATSFFRLSTAP